MQNIAEKLKVKKDLMVTKIKNQEGFTLIELIVVMAIIAVLVLLAAPQFLGYTRDAAATAVRQDSKVLSDAALLYNIDNEDAWPETKVDEDDDFVPGNVTVTTEVGEIEGVKINPALLKDYVKGTKNEVKNYVLVTDKDSEYQGEVLHVGDADDAEDDGVQDKARKTVFGANIKHDKPAE